MRQIQYLCSVIWEILAKMGNIKIKRGVFNTKLELEHAGIKAGFPSPAEDYIHETLDFNRDYIHHPEASFYGDVEGDSMKAAGIYDGDRVIIDKAVEPRNGSIVVAFWNGEFTMKYLDLTHKSDGYIELLSLASVTHATHIFNSTALLPFFSLHL